MIFAHARCGSSQLTNILNLNKINTLYEPFSRGYHKGSYLLFLQNNDLDSTIKLLSSKCQGFKHERAHLDSGQNIYLLENIPNIFLYRKNPVNAALSFLTAKLTKIWFLEQAKEQVDYAKNIKINAEEFLIYTKTIQNLNNFFLEIKSKSIKVTYEDLYGQNGMDYLEKCIEFIGQKIINHEETKKLLMPNKKLNKLPWEKVISNWKEIDQTITKNNLPMPD